MRKELVVYVNTNEEGEEVKVQRVANDDTFILLTAGNNRLVLNVAELMEAIGAIGHYSVLFDQEKTIREARASKAKLNKPLDNLSVNVSSQVSSKNLDDEILFDIPVRNGPTASELALEKEMRLMKGETIVLREED
jgi:hypothetical protein